MIVHYRSGVSSESSKGRFSVTVQNRPNYLSQLTGPASSFSQAHRAFVMGFGVLSYA